MIAAVTGGDVLAIVGSVALVVLIVFLLYSLLSLNKTLAALRLTVEELRRESVPLVSSMRSTVDQASTELDRVDGLITTAESISHTVDSVSRLAYLAFSNPVIKVMAFGSGTARAARRFRRKTS